MNLDLNKELKAFEAIYQPSKEITYCFGVKGYVQLSVEEDHSEIVDRANEAFNIWKASKSLAVAEIQELKSQLDTEKSLRNMVEHLVKAKQEEIEELKALVNQKESK